MIQVNTTSPLAACLFVSEVYWPDAARRAALIEEVKDALEAGVGEGVLAIYPIVSEAELDEASSELDADAAVLFVPLSGGVQPLMQKLAGRIGHALVFNGYLPDALPAALSGRLMHGNAHPACADLYASVRRQGRPVRWLSSLGEVADLARAWNARRRLRNARILKIGETEPWVINSCRDPETIRDVVGAEVIELPREALYTAMNEVCATDIRSESERWARGASAIEGLGRADLDAACRVTAGMRALLEEHAADGLSMACFSMIGEADTTSCLALSVLNSAAASFGACEGDLDAALTQHLLKALGAEFIWIANPIIYPGNAIDLVHCTAPVCACGAALPYRLLRHHESGRGVAPEVALPGKREATVARISVLERNLVAHAGWAEACEHLPACHTQLRLNVESSDAVLKTLQGTHFVFTYGNLSSLLLETARFLGLDGIATELSHPPVPVTTGHNPTHAIHAT